MALRIPESINKGGKFTATHNAIIIRGRIDAERIREFSKLEVKGSTKAIHLNDEGFHFPDKSSMAHTLDTKKLTTSKSRGALTDR